jgi:prepilin-type N-terminal cleavage/methylation domain-containing protein
MNSKGFTLIEILISLAILSLSLLALAGLMVVTTKNNSFGGHLTEAVTFAQDKLEELRAINWSNIVSGSDSKEGATKIVYNRSWNVSTNGGIKTITITVDWNDKTNHSIRLLSVVSQ